MDEIKNFKSLAIALFGLFLFCFGAEKAAFAAPLSDGPKLTLASNTFIFNPRSLTWKAVNHNGAVIKSGRASGGSGYCPDLKRSCRTPSGTYTVSSKQGAGCKSSRFPLGRGGAKMPYCMFFSKNYAIHGSYDVPKRNASHGCIRVRTGDALWLHKNFIKIGTRVVVKPY